jgi:hypothetical protein
VLLPLLVANYALAANIQVLIRVLELLTAGIKAFKEDLKYYKILDRHFKNIRHIYKDKKKSLQYIIAFI